MFTALGAAAGALIWVALWYKNRTAAISTKRLVVIVILIGLACRIVFAWFTPTFYAPDEQPHYNYVKYLYQNHSFPVQTSKTGAATMDWEYHQPPVYYLMSLPIYRLADQLLTPEHQQFFPVRALRFFSILCWAGTVILTLKILGKLRATDQFTQTFVVCMVCLLPTYTFLSASINNDNLVIAIGSMILYFLSLHQRTYHSLVIAGILTGIALLTKLSAGLYVVAIFGVLAARFVEKKLTFTRASTLFCLALIPATLIFTPWGLRNLFVYGSFNPEPVVNVPVSWPSVYRAIFVIQDKIKDTFWATSGIYNNIRFLPTLGVHLTYFALIGLLYGAFAKSRPLFDYLRGPGGAFLIGTGLAIGVNIILTFRFGILYNQGQGRFLFPMLIPISLLMAIGIKLLGISKHLEGAHIHTAGFFIVYVLAFAGHSLDFFARL